MRHPFAVETDRPLAALAGRRNGYIMVAAAGGDTLRYAEIPPALFEAAHAWSVQLERLGAQRVYWFILSEVTPHYHVHLFPRWPDDTLRGIPLFENRESPDEPAWTPAVAEALNRWAERFQVAVIA